MSLEFENRLTKFSEQVIGYCRSIEQDNITKPLVNQLVRSGTSIGANYCEANNASSKKDFQNKIFICKKEAQETKYWLKLLSKSKNNDVSAELYRESHEFVLIFQKILLTMKNKQNEENKL